MKQLRIVLFSILSIASISQNSLKCKETLSSWKAPVLFSLLATAYTAFELKKSVKEEVSGRRDRNILASLFCFNLVTGFIALKQPDIAMFLPICLTMGIAGTAIQENGLE